MNYRDGGYISYYCPYPLYLDYLNFRKHTLKITHNCKSILIPFDYCNRIGKIGDLLFQINLYGDKIESLPFEGNKDPYIDKRLCNWIFKELV